MSKVSVLGANGFIGKALVTELLAHDHEVIAFDRTAVEDREGLEVMSGDFLNSDDLQAAVDGSEYVFHLISTTTPASAENDPYIDIETNLKQSVKLFEICAERGVKKVIFASTGGAIYGHFEGDKLSEDEPTKPVSPYAISKLAIENYLRYFKQKHDLDYAVYRISNPYGPGQKLPAVQGVIPIFLQTIQGGEPITILGDGSMVRDYIYIDDVATMLAGSFDKDMKHAVYNIGSGHGTSVNELVEHIKNIVDAQILTKNQPKPATFVDTVVLDTSRFDSEFNIKPATGLDEGITKTWQYLQQENNK